jgi:hypothetical protein
MQTHTRVLMGAQICMQTGIHTSAYAAVVPSAWDVEPTEKPLASGDFAPAMFSSLNAKLAPKTPWTTVPIAAWRERRGHFEAAKRSWNVTNFQERQRVGMGRGGGVMTYHGCAGAEGLGDWQGDGESDESWGEAESDLRYQERMTIMGKCIYTYTYIYRCIHIYIETEREGERERQRETKRDKERERQRERLGEWQCLNVWDESRTWEGSPRRRPNSTVAKSDTRVVTAAPPAMGTALFFRIALCSKSPNPRETTAGAACEENDAKIKCDENQTGEACKSRGSTRGKLHRVGTDDNWSRRRVC